MKKNHKYYLLLIYFLMSLHLYGQESRDILIIKMQAYEDDIQSTYNEYQKVYYERKSSQNELKAFEDIITVYVSQILEIYETIKLANNKNAEQARDIAARSLIYRALTYLEKAPLNIDFYEKACYDYYQALEMYSDVDDIPIILKPLAKPIIMTNNKYQRLIDIIDAKGKELYSFGKVKIVLKNFKITSNLNSDTFEFIRLKSSSEHDNYTFLDAEKLLKKAFKEIFNKDGDASFFLALPEGFYAIRSKINSNPLYTYLSTIYVRSNQQHEYIIEPLVDWIIIYENTKSKIPDLFKENKNQSTKITLKESSQGNGGNGHSLVFQGKKKDKIEHLILNSIDEIVNQKIEKIDISKIFNLKDPWIRSRFSNLASRSIYNLMLENHYYDIWDQWMLSWKISYEITEKFSPGSSVPSELLILIHKILSEI